VLSLTCIWMRATSVGGDSSQVFSLSRFQLYHLLPQHYSNEKRNGEVHWSTASLVCVPAQSNVVVQSLPR
jgi:hypothetical protein